MALLDRIPPARRCTRFAALLAALAALAIAPQAGAAPIAAKQADAVVESIGVNTHLGYTNRNYNEFTTVRQRLLDLGVRYIRDQVSLGRPDVYSRFRQLAADGIHLDAIAGDPLQRWSTGTIDQQLDLIQKELGTAVASIEGPNEYDLQGDPNWVPVLRDYTRRLWEGVKARPALAGLPVIGPSVVLEENQEALGDISSWVDYGNTHSYQSGNAPDDDARWSNDLSYAAKNSGSKPVQVTECGYNNAVNTTNGHRPASERAAGIYMPRLFLDNFQRGIARTYSYELLDQKEDSTRTDIESSFGLYRNDFSPKPAATALKNLIGLLSDRGTQFTPASLDYGIQGAPSSARQLLLQKRDGSFYLVLWNRVSVWNPQTRTDIDPPDVPITVQLNQPIARAEVYEPNTSASPLSTATNPSAVKLNLSERVSVIKLVPGAPQQTPAPEPAPTPAPTPTPTPTPAPEPAPASTPAPESAPAPTPAPEPQPTTEPAPTPAPESSPSKPVKRHRQRTHRRYLQRHDARVSALKRSG